MCTANLKSAPPSPVRAERAEVPHHLLDCVDPLADVSAGEYARQARRILREIILRESVLHESELHGHLPIVSGGTGLYLRALLEGLFPGPQRSEELRDKLRAARRSVGPSTCIASCGGLTLPRPAAFTANDVCEGNPGRSRSA